MLENVKRLCFQGFQSFINNFVTPFPNKSFLLIIHLKIALFIYLPVFSSFEQKRTLLSPKLYRKLNQLDNYNLSVRYIAYTQNNKKLIDVKKALLLIVQYINLYIRAFSIHWTNVTRLSEQTWKRPNKMICVREYNK